MTNPDGIIAEIDSAIDGWVERDWAVSKDAMRCAPQPPDDGQEPPRLTLVIRPDWEAFSRRLVEVWNAVRPTLEAVAKQISHTALTAHVSLAPLVYGDGYKRHRRRCRGCNPHGNPEPLKVNGADYTRRRKARQRRKR